MADVNLALHASAQVASSHDGNLQALGVKEELLHILLESEQMRLVVWLYPLDHERRHIFSSHSGRAWPDVSTMMTYTPMDTDLAQLSVTAIRAAWVEHPSVAIQLANRFSSVQMQREVRALLLERPDEAIEEPDSLQILLGPSLPLDIGSRLKVSTCQRNVAYFANV